MPGAINTDKELALAFQPLLLAKFTFRDTPATILRLSTHPLNVADGGVQYGGFNWFPRLLDQDIAAVQALSEQGIDIVPNVTIRINDGDKSILTNYEMAVGFKGARVELMFVFYDVVTGTFSTDTYTKFVGICNPPIMDETTLTVTAVNLMNMSQVSFPIKRITRRCGQTFPRNATERGKAVNDMDSFFFGCGYGPDISDGVGNLNSGSPFIECNYTMENCIARLGDANFQWPSYQDTSARRTGRYNGVQWDPPQSWRSRGYTDPQWIEGYNSPNEAKYNDRVPMIYGTSWVDAVVLNVVGDANYTKMEVLLCQDQIQEVLRVVVNDVLVPRSTGTPGSVTWWDMVNDGNRNGAPNIDAIYNGKGDPYGGLAVITITVPRRLVDSRSVPRVSVLVKGPKLRVFSADVSITAASNTTPITVTAAGHGLANGDTVVVDEVGGNTGANGYWKVSGVSGNDFQLVGSVGNGTYTSGGYVTKQSVMYTANPVWILLDMLSWANWLMTDIDLRTFITAASICDTSITYKDIHGATANHARFSTALVMRQPKKAAEAIRSTRMLCRAILVPNASAGGKLQVFIKGTLASEQPAPVAGSNYNTAVSSKLLSGSAADGYVAYRFTTSSITRTGGKLNFSMEQRPISDSHNRLSVTFQDEENQFAFDSLDLIDEIDYARADQEVSASAPIDGLPNYDQSRRILRNLMAENFYGNTRNDTGGTLTFNFETSFKALHLRVGHIIMINHTKEGLTNRLARIIKIQPTANFERVRITATYHNDDWYVDTYGQADAPRVTGQRRNRFERPPFGWSPYFLQPVVNDQIHDRTDWGFNVIQHYAEAEDERIIATLQIAGELPINTFSNVIRPPHIPLQGNQASTGGVLPGNRTVYVAICGIDSGGDYSAPSTICTIDIVAGTSTNTISVPNIDWHDSNANWAIFAGYDPSKLAMQGNSLGLPSWITYSGTLAKPTSITIAGDSAVPERLHTATRGLPDSEFDRLVIKAKKIAHAGVWGAEIVSVTATTIVVSVSSAFTLNQWANYYLTVVGLKDPTQIIPIATFKIASNDTGAPSATLTLAGSQPNPTTVVNGGPLVLGDVVIMRAKATVGIDGSGDNYIEDPNWINSLGPSGLTANAEVGNIIRFIGGTAKGTIARIKSNTSTRLVIEGPWQIVPDATSIYIIEELEWTTLTELTEIDNHEPGRDFTLGVETTPLKGETILLKGVAIDGDGNEAFDAHSPLREIYVVGHLGDVAPPPAPLFSAKTLREGALILQNLSFASNINVKSIREATFQIYYFDETVVIQTTLNGAIDASTTSVVVADATLFIVDRYIAIDREKMLVTAKAGNTLTVTRGQHGSSGASHSNGARVEQLENPKIIAFPFEREYFPTNSNRWFETVTMSSARVATIIAKVTNAFGDSPTTTVDYLASTYDSDPGMSGELPGLRVNSGGTITMQGQGDLEIGNGFGPSFEVPFDTSVRDVHAIVDQAPSGGALIVVVRYDGTVFATLTIADGAVTSDSISGADKSYIQAGKRFTFDITSVGLVTHGADLSIRIRT